MKRLVEIIADIPIVQIANVLYNGESQTCALRLAAFLKPVKNGLSMQSIWNACILNNELTRCKGNVLMTVRGIMSYCVAE